MKLFTITAASIVALVTAIAAGNIVREDSQGFAYYCGEIAAEQRVQREILDDDGAQFFCGCERTKDYAEKYAKGDGIVPRIVAEVGSFFEASGYASTDRALAGSLERSRESTSCDARRGD
jgi:hypothetical protein